MKMMDLIAEATAYGEANSRDPSTKVGGILLIGRRGRKIMGVNTFVGITNPETATREERYEDVVHAEETALLEAGELAKGATYVGSHEPCGRCYRRLIHAGVAAIIFPPTSPERRERWGCEGGRAIAEARGVAVMEVEE